MNNETVDRWNKMIERLGEDNSFDLHGKHAELWLGLSSEDQKFRVGRNVAKIVAISKVHGLTPEQVHENLKSVLNEEVSVQLIEALMAEFEHCCHEVWG